MSARRALQEDLQDLIRSVMNPEPDERATLETVSLLLPRDQDRISKPWAGAAGWLRCGCFLPFEIFSDAQVLKHPWLAGQDR